MTGPIPAKLTIFAAAIFQGLVLIHFVRPSQNLATMALLATLALASVAAKMWERRDRIPHLDFVVISATVGGFGMAVGRWLDARLLSPHHGHHAAPHSTAGHLISFEMALMLILCVVACELLCGNACAMRSARKRILRSIECHACMVMGMVVGASLLPPLISSLLETPVLVAHFSMVIGMVAGMWGGLRLMDVITST